MNRTLLPLALVLAATASAQNERDIQLRSVNFVDGILEISNLGSTTQSLDNWRFCSHDTGGLFTYSAPFGLNGRSLGPGDSLFIHFNNDAPTGDPSAINQTAVGPFRVPLDQDAFAVALFFPTASGSIAFGNSALIADHLQWSDGTAPGGTEVRTAQAVSESLWTKTGEFVTTTPNTNRIELNDLSNGRLHGDDNYTAIEPGGHDEAVMGDLSDDRLNPTLITLGSGDTVIAAEQQGDALGRDIDYVTIDVPAGLTLAEIVLDGFIADPANQAFLGVQQGSIFTTDENNTGITDLFGGIIYGDGLSGTDILPAIGQLGTGFTPPLPAGQYTLWFNQTGPTSECVLRFVTGVDSVGTPFCGPAVPNSTGQTGVLVGLGSNVVADMDFSLQASNLNLNDFALPLVSLDQAFIQMPGNSVGNLCLGGSIGRFNSLISPTGATGSFTVQIDLNAIPQGAGLVSVLPGETWNFQVWHRDTVNGLSSSNFTQGLNVTFQ